MMTQHVHIGKYIYRYRWCTYYVYIYTYIGIYIYVYVYSVAICLHRFSKQPTPGPPHPNIPWRCHGVRLKTHLNQPTHDRWMKFDQNVSWSTELYRIQFTYCHIIYGYIVLSCLSYIVLSCLT